MRAARPPGDLSGHRPPVLVSDHTNGNSRSAVAAVRALAAGGYRPLVTMSGGRSAAASSRACAGVVHVPAEEGLPEFRKAIEDFLATEPEATVMPASDAVLVALELPGRDLVDKAALPHRAAAAGLRVPTTREFASGRELADAAGALDYPVVVKAAVKSGDGDLTRRIESSRELRASSEAILEPVVVQPVATGTMHAVCGVIHDGRLHSAVHQTYQRIWPPDCGTASAAFTTAPDLDLEERLLSLLGSHSGVFQVQLIGDQVIDVNPRVYGSLPLAVAAGANLPVIALQAADGRAPAGIVRGRPGLRYRWLEGDARRLLHDVRRRRLRLRDAGRILLPHRGTAHSIESLRDPGPAMSRLLDVASRMLP